MNKQCKQWLNRAAEAWRHRGGVSEGRFTRLRDYVLYGAEPGPDIRAVLNNDLVGALQHFRDIEEVQELHGLVNDVIPMLAAPALARRSLQKHTPDDPGRAAWASQGGLSREPVKLSTVQSSGTG